MLEALTATLSQNPILTLFLVIGLGYLVGEISFFGFRFGVAGVLFVGLAVGSLGPSVALPEVVASLGLIMNVYTIGIQSGPTFFDSFRRSGYRDTLLTVGVLVFGALLTLGLGYGLGLGGPRTAGLYCGALTSTPALAASAEFVRDSAIAQKLPQERARFLAGQPVVAYSLAYPAGVLGVLLCFQFTRKWWKTPAEPQEDAPEILVRDFVVKNPGVAGRTIGDVLRVHKDYGFVISRIQQQGRTDIARSDVQLQKGDVVAVVGDEQALERAEQIFGERSNTQIENDRSELDFRRVFVSRKDLAGKRIGDLNLQDTLAATITRLRRSDIDVVPTPETRLELGDRVRVLTRRSNFPALAKFFGDSIRASSEADFVSVALGMVIGVLAGLFPIPLPGGTVIRLGLAGGPLLVALVLGKLEHTGRITWTMPIGTNLTIRQIGVLLFVAGVGTKAGSSFAQTFRKDGLEMIAAGAVVTFSVTLLTMYAGYKLLKHRFDFVTGLMSGVQTQSACVAYAAEQARTDYPNVAYASVYAIAAIIKIIMAQLLVVWLGMA